MGNYYTILVKKTRHDGSWKTFDLAKFVMNVVLACELA
jgi:hypothetical protein